MGGSSINRKYKFKLLFIFQQEVEILMEITSFTNLDVAIYLHHTIPPSQCGHTKSVTSTFCEIN